MTNKGLLILIFLIICFRLNAQPKGHFVHYGSENGLPQHTVMNIMQDHKGFMWFSTWDGLCKFDGYTFYPYKIQSGDTYHMRSNRIDYICEDKYGYIWTMPYDKEPHRFDPRTETFMGLSSHKEFENKATPSERIITMPSGKVWILPISEGCICVLDSIFNIEVYNRENKKIEAGKVHNVYEDKSQNSWILTDNGLYMENRDKVIEKYFVSDESQNSRHFYSTMETDQEIWFGSDNGKIQIYDKKRNRFTLFDTQTAAKIKSIKSVNNNLIFIATSNNGFLLYHIPTKKIEHFTKSNLPNMQSNVINSCYIDKSENIWFEQDCLGVTKFNPIDRKIKHFVLKTESQSTNIFPPNFFIFEDINNYLWVHPRGGGFSYYDPEKDKLMPFYNEPFSPDWRFSNMMHAAFSDQQGNLWLSTRSHGLDKTVFSNDIFRSTIVDPNINSSINNDIRSIFEDSNQNLWVSTKGGRVYVYNPTGKQMGYLCSDGTIDFGKPIEGFTYCIAEDRDKNIWLGTKGDGIYKVSPTGKYKYSIKQFEHIENNKQSLSNNSVYSLFFDSKNRLWVGTYGGGLNLMDDNNEGKFFHVGNQLSHYPIQTGSQIRIISSDKNGNICVGTTLGLIMLSSDFEKPEDIEYKSYFRQPGDNTSLGGNDIYDICTTSKGETYIATFGGGVNKVVSTNEKGFPTKFQIYLTKDGLPSDVILSIVEDNDQNLWIATEGNLTKFNPEKESAQTYSYVSRMVKRQNFSEGARFSSKTGTLYFGFSKGILSIKTDRIIENSFRPYIAFTRLQIDNKDVPVGKNSPLKIALDDIGTLILNHKQNSFSIEFAALDYINPGNITYTYKLEGFDKEWVTTKKQRVVNYANMSPGKYILRIKSTNSDATWTDNERTLPIEIVPSFWQTSWAYLLYTIFFLFILFIILRTIFIFIRLKDKVKLEHEQAEMRTKFFIDISHEIRTPLTMVVSPLENIAEADQTPPYIKEQLQQVLKNAERMLKMVNQILDYRKIQKQEIHVEETRIGNFVLDICARFKETADAQNIKLMATNNVGSETLWIDRDGFEKMLYNLLSNSFKFTPKGKSIYVDLSEKDNNIILNVRDEGFGMTKDIQNKLFTRFASFNPDKSKPSTGIGLSIVKEVIDKHKAKIVINSEPGKGTTFQIIFRKGIAHFDSEHTIIGTAESNVPEKYPEVDITKATDNDLKKAEKQTLLIVEDDNDLRTFIVKTLRDYFHILEAENGKDAYDMTINNSPDFILSDIMMPEIDGLELLQKIRQNTSTSHIPFILLTAKTNIESKLEGLVYGADDYITKPFSVRYLRARIENIMRLRRNLYLSFSNDKVVEDKSQPAKKNEPDIKITSKDEQFLKQIKEIVLANIDNSDFVVEDVVTEVAMSRTVFFKKLKSLTGLAPIEFIRDVKIRYAAEMMRNKQYTIKEIAFMVGFGDTKYFTQCFKQIFGVTPSEYRKNL